MFFLTVWPHLCVFFLSFFSVALVQSSKRVEKLPGSVGNTMDSLHRAQKAARSAKNFKNHHSEDAIP